MITSLPIVEMWRLVLNIVLLLKTDTVTANYIFNTSQVAWTDAQKICNVSSVGDIMYTEIVYTKLPNTFTAWTSSRNLTSDWTSFYGCLDVSVEMVKTDEIKKTLNQYFPNSTYAIDSNSVFECAYFCTKKSVVFTFFKNVCKCMHQYELTSHLEKIPVCIVWEPATMENVDTFYSIVRFSLPIFKFEKDFRTKIIQKGERESYKHHCLANRNGTLMTHNCKSEKDFSCKAGETGYGTWGFAIYKCLLNNRSLLENESDFLDYWLRFFRFEEDKGNEQCIAIERNNMSRSLTYQFRHCLDRMPVICKDESESNHFFTPVFGNDGSRFYGGSTESIADGKMKSSLTNSTGVVGEIVVVNVVLFGLCIIFAVMTIFRRRVACRTANKNFRRNNTKTSSMVLTGSTRERNGGILQNENEAVPVSYNDPWELRRNIVHMGELYQQDVINVQTEETET